MSNKSKTELGIFIKSPTIEIIECCGIVGMDFAVIDMEHTPLSPRDLIPLVLASETRELKLIVRLPNLNEEYFKWCLDLGIKHLQVPQIKTTEDVSSVFIGPYDLSQTLGFPGDIWNVNVVDKMK